MADFIGWISILFFLLSIVSLADDWQVALMSFGVFVGLLSLAIWLETV